MVAQLLQVCEKETGSGEVTAGGQRQCEFGGFAAGQRRLIMDASDAEPGTTNLSQAWRAPSSGCACPITSHEHEHDQRGAGRDPHKTMLLRRTSS